VSGLIINDIEQLQVTKDFKGFDVMVCDEGLYLFFARSL